MDTEGLEPVVVEPLGPVDSSESVLDAGQPGHPLGDVHVDSVELPGGVASPEVVPPAPQHGVEIADNKAQVETGVSPIGPVTDLAPDRGHGPRGPLVEEVATSSHPRLAHPMMEAQEVEAFPAVGEGDDRGLVGVQLQPERRQDRRHPLAGLFGPLPGVAQHGSRALATCPVIAALVGSKSAPLPAVPGDATDRYRPALSADQVVREAPATNAATMHVACRSNDWRPRS